MPTRKTARAPTPTSTHRAGRLALLGRPNVGKSTLLNALLGERIAIVSKHPQTTRDRIAGVISTPDAQLVFLDTPGIHPPRSKLGQRMNDLAWQTANDADVVVFLAEAYVDSKDPIHTVDRTLIPKLPKKPTILALTKVDLIKKKERLFPVLETWNALHEWTAIVPLSALKSSGTQRLIQVATELMPLGESLFPDDEISDKPARFFVAEFVREQILKKTFEEVPHGIAVTVERYDEGGKIPVIDVAIHVTKEAHKRIVIGAKGELLKNVGIEARARAEQLLGTQVHLKLWVRVTPDWQENDSNLRDFGYDAS